MATLARRPTKTHWLFLAGGLGGMQGFIGLRVSYRVEGSALPAFLGGGGFGGDVGLCRVWGSGLP